MVDDRNGSTILFFIVTPVGTGRSFSDPYGQLEG